MRGTSTLLPNGNKVVICISVTLDSVLWNNFFYLLIIKKKKW
jgi:hypothetical protein